MDLHGKNLIGFEVSAEGDRVLHAVDPAAGKRLEPPFLEATPAEIDRAARLAAGCFEEYAAVEGSRRADFLDAVGVRIMDLGDVLLDRAGRETALPAARLGGERGRTVGQLAMFAGLLREGSWVGARIDRARPDREPLPKPDLRRMNLALGPVAVFGASNFPLAFSVAGGDTASALAAGCPVVAKAHPAHPGTSELVGRAVIEAARETGMPEGVFSLVQGESHESGSTLVTHPAIRAVGFTGSYRGGKALYDLAVRRDEPIPVYAEMGSSNPLFILPRALSERAGAIAEGLVGSVTLGGGQFCTNPGVSFFLDGPGAEAFLARAAELLAAAGPCTMVHAGIKSAYEAGVAAAGALAGVAVAARSDVTGPWESSTAAPALLVTDAGTWGREARLREELYGPATIAVRCGERESLLESARSLEGHLTATLHGTDEDLEEHADLVRVLQAKAGRLVFNGYPTGVEVCPAMQHGGPFPATTDSRSTSVGTAAIERFCRPVCFQDFPSSSLPGELRDENPLGIWRLLDGELTRDAV